MNNPGKMPSDASSESSSIADSVLASPEDFHGNQEEPAQIERRDSILHRVQTKLSFFNERMSSDRHWILFKSLKIYLILCVCILGIFSIYWGSFFQRQTRFKNLKMLVVIEDNEVVDNVQPAIGTALAQVLQTDRARYYGNWQVQNMTAFAELAAANGNTVFEEVQHQVHIQNYWGSLYVNANASYNLYQAILQGDTSYNVSYNSVIAFYETGRDIISMGLYIVPNIRAINLMFLAVQGDVISSMIDFSTTDISNTVNDSIKVASSSLTFFFMDGIPFTNPVITAPAQVGLIYMVIITFFSFNFFSDVYQKTATMSIKPQQILIFRVLMAVAGFFFISFFFSLVSLAFQVDFTKAFGKAGWLVYWMTNFLTMWAVGAMNEVMAMLLIMLYPPLIGFWMLFWVVTNISATFAPVVLTPNFYRFTHGMPIHAAYEITKVIFFNTYKGHLGRNYGILVAWVVLSTILLALVSALFGKTMGKRAMLARKKIEQEILAKGSQDIGHEIVMEKDRNDD